MVILIDHRKSDTKFNFNLQAMKLSFIPLVLWLSHKRKHKQMQIDKLFNITPPHNDRKFI